MASESDITVDEYGNVWRNGGRHFVTYIGRPDDRAALRAALGAVPQAPDGDEVAELRAELERLRAVVVQVDPTHRVPLGFCTPAEIDTFAAAVPSAPPPPEGDEGEGLAWEQGWMAAAEAYATRLGLYCADDTCSGQWFALHPDGHWFFPATVGGGEHGHDPKMPDAPTAALREWIASEEVAALRAGLTVIADGIDSRFLAAAAGGGCDPTPTAGTGAPPLSDLNTVLDHVLRHTPPERYPDAVAQAFADLDAWYQDASRPPTPAPSPSPEGPASDPVADLEGGR